MSSSNAVSRGFGAFIAIVVLIAAVGGVVWWLAPGILHGSVAIFRATWVVVVPTLVALLIALLLLGLERTVIAFIALVVAIAIAVGGGVYVNFAQAQKVSASIERVNESPAELSFRTRVPLEVATATSSRTLGNTTGTATGDIRALPVIGENGKYSTAVIRRGFLQGYESVQLLDIPLFGTADSKDVQFCAFDKDAKLRFDGGLPVNNLKTAILHRVPLGTGLNAADAVFDCAEENGELIPMVYAPLTKQVGVFITTRVPASVAIYNGSTGEITIEKDYEGDLPLYPQSLALGQRESTQASDGFVNWFMNRSGYEDTSVDEEDPNGANRAEFGLSDIEGKHQSYVTPLTARGSSSSIIAVGTTEATRLVAGELNPYEVRAYENDEVRQANSAIADTITAGVLSGYQAQGLTVFEIAPGEDGNWVATIGKKQSILYRATIEADGTITLRDAKGAQVGAVVSPNGDVEEVPATDPEVPAQNESLSSLSEDELRELGQQVLDELASRAAGNAQGE